MSSSCEPCSTIRPSATTMMTSQPWIVDRRWAIEKEVRPRHASSMAFCTFLSLFESKALVASSNNSTGGLRAKARQMATRCFWPPESRPPFGPTRVSQPWPCSPSRKLRLAIALQSLRCFSDTSPSCRPYFTFSRTVVLKRTGSWPT
mmetsp:Transcript_14994/g.47023  ORF Transcript_14994/g.47023 Transcript_14994/m.47023 type:complete len:147 (-) Transcript_14994:193-633(-)